MTNCDIEFDLNKVIATFKEMKINLLPKVISNLKPKNNGFHFAMLVSAIHLDLVDYYVKNDLKNVKNLLEAYFHLENTFPFFFALLSDNKELIYQYSIISTDIIASP